MNVKLASDLKARIPWIAAAALAGATAFVVAQAIGGFPENIAQFMGSQIVSQGGYSESLTGLIGYGVHFGVALSYATLFAIATAFLPLEGRARWVAAAVVAVALGTFSTLITAPAIATTISLLSGNGFPAQLPDINTSFGFAFWNHQLFFAIAWLAIVVAPDLLRSRSGDAAEASEVATT